MNTNLNKFSNDLENLLRKNKPIIENRDELLFYMFGNTPLENKIDKIFFKHKIFNYFFIGKILFVLDDFKILKNSIDLSNFINSKNYLIIKKDFNLIDLENFIKLNQNIEKKLKIDTNTKIEDPWDNVLKKIKNLNVTIANKEKNKYFNFDNLKGDQFKLSQIITSDFINSCKLLYESKKIKYNKNKLENTIFLNTLTKYIKNRRELDAIIDISKDKVSDFNKLFIKLKLKKEWDNLSWIEIKNL